MWKGGESDENGIGTSKSYRPSTNGHLGHSHPSPAIEAFQEAWSAEIGGREDHSTPAPFCWVLRRRETQTQIPWPDIL